MATTSTNTPVLRRPVLPPAFAAAAIAALALSALPLAGCNTTEGIGRDIEATGDAIEDAASDAKD